jgi:hypothetical protein
MSVLNFGLEFGRVVKVMAHDLQKEGCPAGTGPADTLTL